MYPWVFLSFAIAANVTANILIKKTAGAETVSGAYLDIKFLTGVLIFGLSLMFYTAALRSIPVSLAYPILVGLSVALLTITAIFHLNEVLSSRQVLGLVTITAGVVMVTVGGRG